MASSSQKTVRLRVLFSERSLAAPALENWGRDRIVAVSLLRGRFTSKDATLELEVRGFTRKIAQFMAQISAWGASVGTALGGPV